MCHGPKHTGLRRAHSTLEGPVSAGSLLRVPTVPTGCYPVPTVGGCCCRGLCPPGVSERRPPVSDESSKRLSVLG